MGAHEGTRKVGQDVVLIVAGLANCDPRVARRALERGPGVIKIHALRVALEAAMAQVLGAVTGGST